MTRHHLRWLAALGQLAGDPDSVPCASGDASICAKARTQPTGPPFGELVGLTPAKAAS